MYAVIQTGGKQYRVEPGQTVVVEKLTGDKGTPVTFNLSHSGTQIAAAVALDRRVGIDIERSELTGRDVFEIARRFFSAPEIK